MEEFNADTFFDQVDPINYFAQGFGLIPDPTGETTAASHLAFNTAQDQPSYPSITSHNESFSVLPELASHESHSSCFVDSFNFSTGMLYVPPYDLVVSGRQTCCFMPYFMYRTVDWRRSIECTNSLISREFLR